MDDLSAAGLNQTEAKCYRALLTQKLWLPSELAKYVSETRTNVYKVLDNLTALGLAERLDDKKKLHYRAANPARLLQLARELRIAREEAEKSLESHTESLMRQYIDVHEQAAVRFYQGRKEITEIFDEVARSKTTVSFISTIAGIDFYGYEFMHNLRMKAVDNCVGREALTPDTALASSNYAETDKTYRLSRTWLNDTDYTAPVEWGSFEDKLYIISYGKEALGIVIESPQIAEAFTQLFQLLKRGQGLLPDYDKLPRLVSKHPAQA